MSRRTNERLQDVVDAIDNIDALLNNKAFDAVLREPHARAALERYFEVLSEASRHIPKAMQDEFPGINWRDVADIGNIIRHAYHRVDLEILWNSYESGELYTLREACRQLRLR